MIENLYLEYFYRRNGKPNEITLWLDCHQMPQYFTFAKTYPKLEPYELFLSDLWFSLQFDQNCDFRDIHVQDRVDHSLFDIQQFKGKGNETFHDMMRLLDEGYIVPFETFSQRVPYLSAFTSYDAPYPPSIHSAVHSFVAVGYTDQSLYVVEAPWSLNKSHWTPSEENTSVGVIPISNMLHAFDCFLNYSKLSVRRDGYDKEIAAAAVSDFLIRTNSSEKAFTQEKENSNETILFHLEGLNKLYDLIKNNRLDLGQTSSQYPNLNQCELIQWKFSLVKNRRAIFEKALQHHVDSYPSNKVRRALHHLSENEKHWELLLNIFKKMLIRGDYHRNLVVAEKLQGIIESEQNLYDAISALSASVHQKI